MRHVPLLILVFLVSPLTAFSQEDKIDRPERTERRERRRGDDDGRRMGRRLDWFAKELDLDEAQRKDFDEIMNAQRERMREMRPQWEAIREAQRNGERERAEELRAQLGDQANPRDLFRQAFDELEPILDDAQYDRLQEMRTEMTSRQDRRREERRVVEELPDELDMNEEQRAQYKELIEGRRTQMREQWSQMRPLMEEMRQAEEDGDTERAEEIREQLRARRPDSDDYRKQLLDDVSKILGEDQQPLLNSYYLEIGIADQGGNKKSPDVRTVLLAARRVRVDSDTKSQISAIGKEAMRELRKVRRETGATQLTEEEREAIRASKGKATKSIAKEIRRRNDQAVAAVAQKTKQRIVRLLSADQVAVFEKELEKAARANVGRKR